MLHTDLIAPIPELLRRHARGARRQMRLSRRAFVGDLCRAAGAHRQACRPSRRCRHRRNDTVAIMLPNSVQWVESCLAIARAGAISVPISYDSTEPEIAYRLADADCKAVFTTAERGDLLARLQASAPNLKTLIVTDRGHCSAAALRYAKLVTQPPQSAPRDPASLHETAFILYTSGTTGRAKGVAAHGARHVVGHGGLLGADHRLERTRHRAVAAAAVSFLRAQSVGAEHPGDRRERIHHGEILDQRGGAAAQDRRIHLFPRRADDVSLSAAGDARRERPAVSQSAALRFGRRHHAGDAQPRIRKPSRRARCSTATASPKPRPW